MANPKERKRVQKLARKTKARPTPASGAIGRGTYDLAQCADVEGSWAIEEKPSPRDVLLAKGAKEWDKLFWRARADGKMPALIAGEITIISTADFVELITRG